MITLKKAMRLCEIEDGDIFRLTPKGEKWFNGVWWSGKEARNKLDLKHTVVTKIKIAFEYENTGEHFEFEILLRK